MKTQAGAKSVFPPVPSASVGQQNFFAHQEKKSTELLDFF